MKQKVKMTGFSYRDRLTAKANVYLFGWHVVGLKADGTTTEWDLTPEGKKVKCVHKNAKQ